MYIGRQVPEAPIDIERFDPLAVAHVAEEMLRELKEPRRRAVLQNFIDHARAEAQGDYDALMASCSRKRQSYAVYGSQMGSPKEGQPQSYAELKTHYRMLIELNLYLIHFEAEKLTVGEDEVWVEGVVHMLLRGQMAQDVYSVKVDDPDGVYMLNKRTVIAFIFDEDGLSCGEHAYSDGPTTAANLSPVPIDQVPEQFWNNPLTGPVPRSLLAS